MPESTRPLCFVLMPFGRKPGADGALIDFDQVYAGLLAPAIREAGLEAIRADQEVSSGIIHKAMFERLILCPYAVADLTLGNANVFYELGVRHAFRPSSTVQVYAAGGRLPFDVQMLRTAAYRLNPDGSLDEAAKEDTRKTIAAFLNEAKHGAKDSPLFQLLDGLVPPELDHAKTDVFRERVEYEERIKEKLAAARQAGADAVRAAAAEIGAPADAEAGVVIDLYLSYRAVKAWPEMVSLASQMPKPLARTAMVREQLGFALNRMGKRKEAEEVLLKLIEERGRSSETCGLLGRVYKDLWEEASKAGPPALAAAYLAKAADMYLAGFEADWRDAYPGINAVTLMELAEPPDPRREQLLPVVRYAVERKMARGKPDYWDWATQLELAVLAADEAAANQALGQAMASVREKWEPETTVRNLRLIREARERRGAPVAWAQAVEDALAVLA